MPPLRRLDRRRGTTAATACATSPPPARCTLSARCPPVTHDRRPAHCARSLLSPTTPTAFDPDRIGSWKAPSLRHQHRQESNLPGGGGKPGKKTDHNRPELELGRTLPSANGRVKRDGGRSSALAVVARRPLGARRHGNAEVVENVSDQGRPLADGADAHGPVTTGAPEWIHLLLDAQVRFEPLEGRPPTLPG
jgi:hypothetical protein